MIQWQFLLFEGFEDFFCHSRECRNILDRFLKMLRHKILLKKSIIREIVLCLHAEKV